MRWPLRPIAPSLGDAAGRPRNGPDSNGPELPPSQETGEVRSRAILFRRTGQPSTPAREGAEDKMKTILLRTAFLSFVVFALSLSLEAQNSPPDAHLSGTLTDLSGYGVGNVKVTAQLENGANTRIWSAISGADGDYLLALPPGRYHIHFQHASFVPRDVVLDLAASETRTFDLRLEIEPLSENVVVTANTQPTELAHTPAPVGIVGPQEIEQRQAVSLPDLLSTQTGISISRTGTNGGTTSIFLNGGNSSFTEVLVDGTPINPPGGAVDFSSLTTDNVDKVEIVRGAESAIYGSDAVSGVVQLFSHRGETRVPSLSLLAEGGGFSSARGTAQLSGLINRFDYSGAASYFQTDGQGRNDTFLDRTLTGNFGYSISDSNQLRLSIRNNTSDAGIPGQITFTPPSLYQRYNQDLFSANARWSFSTGPHWRHQLMGTESYLRQHSFNPQQSYFATDPLAFCPQTNPTAVPTAEFCDFIYDDLLRYNRAGSSVQTTYSSRNFAATAGYQYEVENGSISYILPAHLRRNNQGGYLDFRFSPFPRLSLDFGARAEANQNFGTRVVPRAGGSLFLRYGHGFWGDTRYRVFYGQGIKEPRFDQTFGSDPCFPGNPSLKPEASKGWSTGFDQKLVSNRLKLTADYFYNRFYDVVSFAYNPPPNPGFCGTYFNTDLAFARGVNFSAEMHPSKWLHLLGNYTYDDTRVLKSENPFFDPALLPGNRLIRRPVNSGSMALNFSYAQLNWNLVGYFSGVRTDSNFVHPVQTNNPGYVRFDVATSYNFSRGFSFYGRVLNLLDKQYQDAIGYPALGRDFRLGLNYRFTGRN
jgi:vitamin B12 transporter